MNYENDFGFSLVSESELKAHEEALKKQVAEQSTVVTKTSAEAQAAQDKLTTLKNMVMPLLHNLAKDPDRHYIFWPNRKEKIDEFIAKIEQHVGS